MKFLISILILIYSLPAFGWLHPYPDYSKQMDDADLVAVVNALKITDTGTTKRLDPDSKIIYREFEVELMIKIVLKGETKSKSTIKCRLYRYPNKVELKADLDEREGLRENIMSDPWESCLFVPIRGRDYLVFLKQGEDGGFLPVTGVESAIYSMIQLEVPFGFDHLKTPDDKGESK